MKSAGRFALLTFISLMLLNFLGCAEGDKAGTTSERVPPTAPSDLRVEKAGKYRALLSWRDNSTNEDGFILERKASENGWEPIAQLKSDETKFEDASLLCGGMQYEYRVKAYNDAGHSSYSNAVKATTKDCWTFYAVDVEGNTGWFTSSHVDSNGKAHIAYFDFTTSSLKYATNSAGGWVIQTIQNLESVLPHNPYPSLKIDSNDKVHISYLSYIDQTALGLKYATNSSGSWQIFDVDHAGYLEWMTSLTIDSNDKVHITYNSMNIYGNELSYAYGNPGNWTIVAISDPSSYDIGLHQDIEVDSEGKVHIVYYDFRNDDLRYVVYADESWTYETIDSDGIVGWYPSMAMDSKDNLHISYYDCGELQEGSVCSKGDLKYATNEHGEWQITTVDDKWDAGYYTSIALDSQDVPHISYYEYLAGDLKYATKQGEGWVIFNLDAQDRRLGAYTSISVDSDDKVHISYLDLSGKDLKYATTAEDF